MKFSTIGEPASNTRTVLVMDGNGPVMMGDERVPDLRCGKCTCVLVHGVAAGRLDNVVFKCKTCGAFNDSSKPLRAD